MSKRKPVLRRFSELAPEEDPQHVAALIRSARAAPEEDLPGLRWRLRTSLQRRAPRPRLAVRIALVVVGVFVTGTVVGAVVRPFWERKLVGADPAAEPAAKAKPTSRRRGRSGVQAKATLPVAELVPPLPPAEIAGAPAMVQPPQTRVARRLAEPRESPPPAAAPEAPVPPPPPSVEAVEQTLLSDVLRALRTQRDPQTALVLLDEHASTFPQTVMAPEAAMLRAEALLGLGRNREALAQLDGLALASMPRWDDWLVLRGELRAAAGRWREAGRDFEAALAGAGAAGSDARALDLMERALWGRASARSHLGDDAGARADLAAFLRRFPSGRFAAQAKALLRGSP